ncbi:YjgN family protein [Qipengyuania sp. XHP0207]|uniref:YjgN family protein n=1 Tax=Qipengyuania sp. XHP0207 TaxID=3038078 RepID=UPI00241C6B9A|nr:YjgN family protein [Qipengyuania sp. XHP0207]MDG5747955.1 YjgN family protein [Qipengyuania sp. XHP0207]
MHGKYDGEGEQSAFVFEGTWREFAPIAFTNLLLTIVTLGIYRFWATARERRYLWSKSRFVDEQLEWAGTGKELFFGFLIVLLLFAMPVVLINFVAQALIARGQEILGALLGIAPLLIIFYLTGVARFRGLRYRLSRTRWRGIRGGSDEPGFRYGLSYMWKSIVAWIPLGLLIPWSMTSLWNERWNKMSFGPYQFQSDAEAGSVFARFFVFYLAPFIMFGGAVAMAGMGMLAGYGIGGEDGMALGGAFGVIGMILFFYLGLGLIAVAFYAKFYREVVGATRWKDLNFSFEASTMDWVKLLIGDALLVVFTLGIGLIFLSYRHWKFFITHLEANGEILLDELTQSTTRTARHGEGLLDAFDMGAI